MPSYLKDFEEELLSCLEGADVSKLAEEMLEGALVSREDLEFLSHMPHQQQLRYLLRQIDRQLGAAEQQVSFPLMLEKCFQLLARHGISDNLLQEIKAKYDVHIFPRPTEENGYEVPGVAGLEGQLLPVASNVSVASNVFREEHVNVLAEILAQCSSKWNEIGISLNLPHNLLQRLLGSMHLHSGEVCLYNLLWEWVIKCHLHAKPPTVDSLKTALRSNMVKLGSVAASLERSLLEHGVCFESEPPPLPKRLCLEGNGHPILPTYQSTPPAYTTIPSIPFVQNSCGIKPQNFDPLIIPGGLRAGNRPPGLRSLETSGDSSRLIKHKKVLVDVYSAQPEVPDDSWPPISNNVYINLALVKQGGSVETARNTIQKGMEEAFNSQESVRYETLFSDLGTGSRLLIEGRPGSGKSTLVHRASQDWAKGELQVAGVELLFLIRLRHFFGSSEITLYDLIKYHYSDKSTVDEIVQFAEENSGEGLCFILDGLDEYTPEGRIQDTVIYKLISKEILPKAIVIIASRPSASAKIRKMATKQVETLGFLKNEIIEFVAKYKFSSPNKTCCGLLSYLDHHPNVMHMCYLPIHTAMVCHLYDEMGSTLPRTETEMYKQFTIYTLLRTLCRGEPPKVICLNSVEDLPSKERSIFIQICKLAFEKTKLSRHVMKSSEIKFFDEVISSDKESLGLITVDHIAKIHGMENLYTFLHLTFQEYLAAYHVAHLEEEEQMAVISKYCNKKNMQVVWKFFCGLVDFTEQASKFNQLMKFAHNNLHRAQYAFESQQFSVCSSVVQSEGSNRLSYDGCFLNPSDFTAIGYVLRNSASPIEELVLNKCEFGEEGIDAFLKEAGDRVRHIRILSYNGDQVSVQPVTMNKLLRNLTCLETLDITNTVLESQNVEKFTEEVKLPELKILKVSENQCNFETLLSLFKICGNNFQGIKFYPLDSPVRQSLLDIIIYIFGHQVLVESIGQFPHIHLRGYKLGYHDLNVLSRGIMDRQYSQCTDLILINCGLGNEESKVLSKTLEHLHKLRMLNISFNHIGDKGAKVLAKRLKYCPLLEVLDVSVNEVGSEGAKAILKATENLINLNCRLWNHKLAECDNSVSICGIEIRSGEIDTMLSSMREYPDHYKSLNALKVTMNSIEKIVKGLKFCASICVLKLVDNVISNLDVRTLAKGIRWCKQLKVLEFKSVSFTNESAKTFFDNIKSSIGLTELNFKKNSIGINGAKALAECLRHFNKIQTLKINSNDVGDDGAIALAEGLKHCRDLQVLSLNNNGIEETKTMQILAGELKHCKNLQSLDLGNNSFSTDGAVFLANGLKHCPHLLSLDLSGNYIGYDGAEALAKSLKQFGNLCTLHLGSNQINIDSAKAISLTLKQCENLQSLDLDWNDIDVDGAIAIAESLKYCNRLCSLRLSGNFIGNDGAKALSESLKCFRKLQVLSLDKNVIDVDGAIALAENLKYCDCIHTLHLSENEIGVDGARAIANSLRSSSLQALHMDGNEIGMEGVRALAETLKHCSNLHTLHLNENFIRVDGMRALAGSLKFCTRLCHLHLDGNFIGVDGTIALSQSLKYCFNLHTLHLDWNEMGIDGAKALADSLKHCSRLQTLHLVGNHVGAEGAMALAESLKHCNDLHTLHLDGNEIGLKGVMALAESLKYFNSLLVLCLDWNDFNVEGAKSLACGLKCCVNLHTLHLDGNQVGADGAKALAESLLHCKSLHTLHLETNEIGDRGAKSLVEGLKNCSRLHSLNLAGNEIGKGGVQSLMNSLRHCNNINFS